jgi:hypothetical protein
MAEGEKPAGSGTAFELPAQIPRVTLPPMPLPCPGLPSFAVYFRFRCGRRRPGSCLGDDRDGRAPGMSSDDRLTLASVSDCGSAAVVVRHDRWSVASAATPERGRSLVAKGK